MMGVSERSMRQLNPLGSAGSWELAVVLGLATLSYAVLSTISGNANVTDGNEMSLAMVLLTIAVVANMVLSAPRRGTYRRINYVIVVGLGLGAALLQGVASQGGVASIATDWGPLALAGILAAASAFRPRADQLWAGFISSTLIAVQKLYEAAIVNPPYGATYFVVTAIAPVVIVTLGQSAYTGFAIRSLISWRRGFSQTQADVTSLVGLGAARKIGQDFLSDFSVDVQPLLSRVLKNGKIAVADSEVASVAAERIRTRLVALSQETWLERLDVVVFDPARRAEEFDLPARAAIRALLASLSRPNITNVSVTLAGRALTHDVRITITGQFHQQRFLVRTQLAPILRVLYVVFLDVKVVFGAESLTLKFDYGVEHTGE
jgi:hypothetical protein